MEENIKIFRLHSGEDIMANCVENVETETVLLQNPMHVIFKRIPTGQTIMMMMPWLPIELIEVDEATLYLSDILTTIEPKKDFIEYYHNLVIEAKKRIEKPLDLDMFEDEESDEEYQEDDVDIDELMQLLKDKKDKVIH